ncbi:MAG: hypothetical protein AAFP15_06880 [Bacteroidota bacterium]
MPSAFWFSFALGAGLGVCNAAASYAVIRHALTRPDNVFIRLVLSSLVVRIVLLLLPLLLLLLLLLVDVQEAGFVTGLLGAFVLGVGGEWWLLKGRDMNAITPTV